MSEDLKDQIIKDVREWINKSKFTISDVSRPDIDIKDIVIHAKCIVDENPAKVKKEKKKGKNI